MVHENAIVILKTITLLLGGLITYYSYKAYRRTQARALRALTIGFGFITIGSLIAGVLDQLTGLPTTTGIVFESFVTAVGFGVILYSLYAD